MASYIKTEQLFFVPQLFAECPGRNLRRVAVILSRRCELKFAKQRNLTSPSVALRRCPSRQRLIDLSKQFRTVVPSKIKGPRTYEVLKYFAVDRFRIEAAAVVFERLERPVLLSLHDCGFHGRFTN